MVSEEMESAKLGTKMLVFLDNAFGFEDLHNAKDSGRGEALAYANTISRLIGVLPGGVALGLIGARLLGMV